MADDLDKAKAIIKKVQSPAFLNPILLTTHQQVKKRIFTDGKDAKNANIGLYTLAYLKRRMKKGFNSSRKVILEFTGQMRRDFVPIKQRRKIIGSGFLNQHNHDKSDWVENTYGKKIFDLTTKEKRFLDRKLQDEIDMLT